MNRRAHILFASSLLGVALLPAVGIQGAASASVTVDNSLVLIGTPDEPFSGGRYFNLTQWGADIRTSEQLLSTFHRTRDSDDLWEDPEWSVSVDPTQATPETTFELDHDSTVFRLGREVSGGTEWMGESCPDLTGEVQFHEATLDGGGVPSSLSASFELHCESGAEDVLYGTYVYRAPLPSLPAAATELIAADAAYPNVPGGEAVWFSNPDNWEGLAVRVDGDNVEVRWDARDGFECAALLTEETGQQEVLRYLGRDDTVTLTGVDPMHLLYVEVYFGSSLDATGDQCLGLTGSSKLFITPLDVEVAALPSRVAHDDTVRVHGTVQSVPDSYVEAENVSVKVFGTNGITDTLLGQTRSDENGRWSVEFPADKTTDLQVVVPDGRAGWGRVWPHFGRTLDAGTLQVAHAVRAAVHDTTVQRGNAAVVTARLLPASDSIPLYLERLSREGTWITVDMQVTAPGETTELTLPLTRRGWQALRVVGPGDGWHARGVSKRVRVYGY